MSQYVGDYFSKEWVFKNVLKYSEEDIKDLKSQVEDEIKSGEVADPATAEEED